MSFLLAIIAYRAIGLLPGWITRLAAKGEPWLVGVGDLAYAVALARPDALPKEFH